MATNRFFTDDADAGIDDASGGPSPGGHPAVDMVGQRDGTGRVTASVDSPHDEPADRHRDPAEPDDEPPPAPPGKTNLYISEMLVLAHLGGVVVALLLGALGQIPWGQAGALAFGFGVVGVTLLLLHLIGRPSGLGVLRPLVGGDKRISTSLTQVALWTVAVGDGVGYLLGTVIFSSAAITNVFPAGTWDDYLILLGGPFAAAVLARGIVTYKLDAGVLQPTEPKRTRLRQVATNDAGSTDLVDAQYLLFNVIALGYFVVELSMTKVLPTIPAPLLALTSSTAAAYVANKAAQRNAPKITSVSPSTVHPGAMVTVFGSNFDPADKQITERRITVTVGSHAAVIYSDDSADTYVRFRMPHDVAAGRRQVKVLTTAGVESPPHLVWVKARAAHATGTQKPPTRGARPRS